MCPKTANWQSNPICMHGQTTACQNPKNEQLAACCMHVIEQYATYSLPANAWPLAYCKVEASCSCHSYKRKTLSLVSYAFSLRVLCSAYPRDICIRNAEDSRVPHDVSAAAIWCTDCAAAGTRLHSAPAMLALVSTSCLARRLSLRIHTGRCRCC